MAMNGSDQPYLGIIHLSDIHFSINNDFITKRFDLFFSALKDDFQKCQIICIVISGDIANTGCKLEYDKAENFLNKLSEKLKERYKYCKIDIIMVPGNHDCDFEKDSKARQGVINRMSYDLLGEDNSVENVCCTVQEDYWNFYKKYQKMPKSKIYYTVFHKIFNKKVCFHCLNTSWMSQIDEKPGSLFLPIKNISELMLANECDLSIAIFHHPLNWFNPKTTENNRNEIQNELDVISSVQIVGHEHVEELRSSENIDRAYSKILYISGNIFQNLHNQNESGFQTLFIELSTYMLHLRRYQWRTDIYRLIDEKDCTLDKKSTRVMELTSDFMSELDVFDLPMSFQNRNVTLSDLYVYPHLEEMSYKSSKKMEDYTDSLKLLDLEQKGTYLLEGEGQIGKTSLLRRLMLEYYEKGYYPLILNGANITNDNVDSIIRRALKSQYVYNDTSFDRYRQLPREKKILLIDDLHVCKLSKDVRKRVIENMSDLFGFVFITVDTAYSILPECQSAFSPTKIYSIKPLGYSKRNQLVEKYVRSQYSDTTDDVSLFEKAKEIYGKLGSVLGNRLIPCYPVFVLTIIQSLDFTPIKTNETSYGYCYQTLIHLALTNAEVTQDLVDSYMNFITELAFEMFLKGETSISENDLFVFYNQYGTKYWIQGFDLIRDRLLDSKILKNSFGEYQFGYIYVLYFLAAKKIAEMLDTIEGKKIVEKLFEQLHIEKNANILVFITHHTKNNQFIEESIFRAMTSFEDVIPITLEKSCSYSQLLNEIVIEIRNDVIEMRDPALEREKLLIEQDKFERENGDAVVGSDIGEDNVHLQPFLHAFRAIEIVGQIVKNRKGSLQKTELKEMIAELYYTGFRMVQYLGDMLKLGSDELARKIQNKAKDSDSIYEIEENIFKYLQILSLQICLGTFSKIVLHVGIKELDNIFNEVAREINTPAAHLVSFSINSYYGKVDMGELQRLIKEFKGNYVALEILKSRMKAYIYNNYVDYRTKQKIGAYLDMKIPAIYGQKSKGIQSYCTVVFVNITRLASVLRAHAASLAGFSAIK